MQVLMVLSELGISSGFRHHNKLQVILIDTCWLNPGQIFGHLLKDQKLAEISGTPSLIQVLDFFSSIPSIFASGTSSASGQNKRKQEMFSAAVQSELASRALQH